MKILYIHGLGSGKYSETPKRLQAALPEAKIVAPEIPIDPAEAQRFLEENFLNDASIDLLVGSSLGGFYSLLLEHHKKVLANPALFADEDIRKQIGLGEQAFLSPRENGATTYVIDEHFIHGLAMIREKIFRACSQGPGKPTQEQIDNTWAIFAHGDELLSHHDDFCRLFRPDHAFWMEGEHRVSEENMRTDIIPLIKRILDTEEEDKTVMPVNEDELEEWTEEELAEAEAQIKYILAHPEEYRSEIEKNLDRALEVAEKRAFIAAFAKTAITEGFSVKKGPVCEMVSGPSGSGKTSLIRKWAEDHKDEINFLEFDAALLSTAEIGGKTVIFSTAEIERMAQPDTVLFIDNWQYLKKDVENELNLLLDEKIVIDPTQPDGKRRLEGLLMVIAAMTT